MEIILYAQFSNFEGCLPLGRSELKRMVETPFSSKSGGSYFGIQNEELEQMRD